MVNVTLASPGAASVALTTSTVVNVGLARDKEVLGSATVHDRLAHVEQLTPLVRSVLGNAGVALAAPLSR